MFFELLRTKGIVLHMLEKACKSFLKKIAKTLISIKFAHGTWGQICKTGKTPLTAGPFNNI